MYIPLLKEAMTALESPALAEMILLPLIRMVAHVVPLNLLSKSHSSSFW